MDNHIRSPLLRAVKHKLDHQQANEGVSHDEWYSVRVKYLKPRLYALFTQFRKDEETEQFLSLTFEKSEWFLTHFYHSIMKSVLSWFMTQTSINGLLQRGSMFVFSSRQFQALLGLADGECRNKLLDIGAGDGNVTVKMAPFFDRVFVTELSPTLRWRLSQKGFTVLDAETWNQDSTASQCELEPSRLYDVVTCLNILDRCDAPMTLLQRIKAVINPTNGLLVLALVFPVKQYVESNSDHVPSELIDISASHVWEVQLQSFLSNVIQPAGFELVRWTRLPYLCEGDFTQSFYYLNDIVMVLRVADP